ncbi:MAG: molybdopterin-dependent oxidoreductase [Pseudomonadota bacterium]
MKRDRNLIDARLADLKPELKRIERRLFLRQSLSLGALTMLSGCDISDNNAVQTVLDTMSRWNDGAQGLLFSKARLAKTYSEADITDPFPFNAFYSEDEAPVIDGATYRLQLSGKIENKKPWSVSDLRKLPQESQITRHICVEGWSAIGQWSGVPFHHFLKQIGADTTAKYVGFKCADKYYTSIDMPTALHPQTIIALDWRQGELPTKYGYPMKLRIPTKLGFKNPKHIAEIFVTNDYPGGYWEDQGYNWYSGS